MPHLNSKRTNCDGNQSTIEIQKKLDRWLRWHLYAELPSKRQGGLGIKRQLPLEALLNLRQNSKSSMGSARGGLLLASWPQSRLSVSFQRSACNWKQGREPSRGFTENQYSDIPRDTRTTDCSDFHPTELCRIISWTGALEDIVFPSQYIFIWSCSGFY